MTGGFKEDWDILPSGITELLQQVREFQEAIWATNGHGNLAVSSRSSF